MKLNNNYASCHHIFNWMEICIHYLATYREAIIFKNIISFTKIIMVIFQAFLIRGQIRCHTVTLIIMCFDLKTHMNPPLKGI